VSGDAREPAAAGPKRPAPWVHLTGYALVALGVYFGLRSMRPSEPSTPASQPTQARAAPPAPVEQPATATRRPGDPPERIDPPGNVDARSAVEPAVRAALEKHRQALLKSCWEPVAGKGAATGKFSVRVLIDADGHELTRSVRRDSGPDDVKLIGCLGDTKKWPIQVPPPGMRVGAVVTLSFP
jgi:hypothetical protein